MKIPFVFQPYETLAEKEERLAHEEMEEEEVGLGAALGPAALFPVQLPLHELSIKAASLHSPSFEFHND